MQTLSNGRGGSVADYLLMWLCLVGPCVGLEVPLYVAERIKHGPGTGVPV